MELYHLYKDYPDYYEAIIITSTQEPSLFYEICASISIDPKLITSPSSLLDKDIVSYCLKQRSYYKAIIHHCLKGHTLADFKKLLSLYPNLSKGLVVEDTKISSDLIISYYL